MWENVSLLKFNSPKCKILHVNNNENPNLSYTVDVKRKFSKVKIYFLQHLHK